MKQELPIFCEDANFGAQYHNFFVSIVLSDKANRHFLYQYYLSLMVKHMHDSHVDFSYDGIYSCIHGLLEKHVIRGVVPDLTEMVCRGLRENHYVIVNVNEKYLPYREAYGQYDFRHDLLIYGFDEAEKKFHTVGFDERFHYRTQEYSFATVEKAYYKMQSEWDFELFYFRLLANPPGENDYKFAVMRSIRSYLDGQSKCTDELDAFLHRQLPSIEFTNDSYYGYHGIGVYDYLLKRMRRFTSLFDSQTTEIDGGMQLGVTDVRSLQVMIAQKKILRAMVSDTSLFPELTEVSEQMGQELRGMLDILLMAKMLLLQIEQGMGGRKEGKRIIKLLTTLKQKDDTVMCELLQILESHLNQD